MRTVLRLIARGVGDMALHPLAHTLGLAAVTLAVFLGGVFLMALTTVDAEFRVSRGEAVWQVYWRPGTPLEQVRPQWDEVRRMPWLTRAETWTPDDALAALAKRLGGADALPSGGVNPLPPTALLVFSPREVDAGRWARETQSFLKNLPGVERVTSTPLKDEFGRMWRGVSAFVVWPSVAFLTLVLALVSASSVRLTLEHRRDEIEILKLVGARNWYIRLPLLVGGAMLGLVGGGAALALLHLVYRFVGPFFAVPPLLMELHFPPPEQAVLLVAVPVLMGLTGGWMAVRDRN